MPNQLKIRPISRKARGKISGVVLFEGLAVPHAIVCIEPDRKAWAGADPFGGKKPHPGTSHGQFLTADGQFESEDLEPGNYFVSAAFQFGSIASIPTQVFPHRVSIASDGKMLVFDAQGRVLGGMSRIELRVAPETPAKGLTMSSFRGTLRFIDSIPKDLKTKPLLIAAREIQGRSKWLAAITGPVKDGEASFELSVPAGFKYILQLQSVHWAPVSCVPQTDQIVVARKPVEVAISVVRAGAVHVRVREPNGKAYSPSFEGSGTGGKDCHYLDMRLLPDAMCFDRLINPDGTVDLVGVPPGVFVAETFCRGEGFPWFVPGVGGIQVRAGQTTKVDLKMKKAMAVRIKPQAASLPPLRHASAAEVGLYEGRERWVRPLAAGTPLDLQGALRLFIREFHGRFQFKQDSKGFWHAPQASSAGGTQAEPGCYDLYLMESSVGWGPAHYLRILAKKNNFQIGGKKSQEISFKGLPLERGKSTLSGEILNFSGLDDKQWLSIDGDFIKLLELTPAIILRGSDGTLVACAWAQPSKLRDDAGFCVLIEALATGRFDALKSLLRSARYVYEIPNLPAGAYGLELWTPEREPLKRRVVLDGKSAVSLSL